MTIPEHGEQITIINPEVPDTPEEKIVLLQKCLTAIATDGIVEGITPRHVTQDGAVMINRALGADRQRSGL